MKHSHPAIGLVALCAALALPSLAAAQEARKTLTRDELRACLNEEDALLARRAESNAAAADIDKEIKALQQEQKDIEQEQKDADGNSLRMASLERRQKRYTQQAKAMQARLDSRRAAMETLKSDLEAHNGRCANVAVSKEDKDAVMQERAAAGKK